MSTEAQTHTATKQRTVPAGLRGPGLVSRDTGLALTLSGPQFPHLHRGH